MIVLVLFYYFFLTQSIILFCLSINST